MAGNNRPSRRYVMHDSLIHQRLHPPYPCESLSTATFPANER
jgi:hypothetical protein